MKASSIGLIRCDSYKEKEVNDAVKAITRPFSYENKGKLKGKKIAIYFDFPAPNVQVVKEVVRFLRDEGVSEISAGASLFTGYEKFDELREFFKKENIKFVDFRNAQYEKLTVPLLREKMPEHFRGYSILSPVQYTREKQYDKMGIKGKRILKYSFIPTLLTEADYVIPILKLKVSPITGLGGVVSSVLSFVPTLTRNEILINKLKFQMERSMLEVYALIKDRILFSVIDGIEADLSDNKEINAMHVIIFGEDGLAVDSVSAVLIGYRSRDIKTNKLGDDIGLGSGLFSHVSIYGDNFLEFRKEAKRYLKFTQGGKRLPYISVQDKNILMRVEQFCPTGAIVLKNGKYSVDKTRCVGCNFCVELAPHLFKI